MQEAYIPRERSTSAHKEGLTKPLFEPLSYLMVRTPLFPVEAYQRLHAPAQHSDGELSVANPHVRLAITVGSRSLLEELERATASPRDALRRERKLLRYLIRMSTRPTPYGLFAGVALGRWDDSTDLSIANPSAHIQARLDMGWLLPLIWKLEAVPEVRRHLYWTANTAVYLRNGRAYLHERAAADTEANRQGVSIRATTALKRALELARQPIAFTELVQQLLAFIPGATPDKVEAFLTELWQQTVLFSDLRPPLTGQLPPPAYLQQRLAAIPLTSALAEQLKTLQEEIHVWEGASWEEKLPRYRVLLAHIEYVQQAVTALCDSIPAAQGLSSSATSHAAPKVTAPKRTGASPPESLLQVDMRLALDGHSLASQVVSEVARMAEVLLRLTPLPHGLATLAAYRKTFLERYGQDREVPLVELLDQNFGLGPLETPGETTALSPMEEWQARRNQTLVELALTAQQRRQMVLELDEKLFQQLETWTPDPATAPLSLDLNVFIAASSATEVDAGQYQLALGPNLGGQQAGANFGRFAPLLGREGIEGLCNTANQLQRLASDRLLAEVVYLPKAGRMSNVVIRPAVHQHELLYGASPGVSVKNSIPWDELTVRLRNNRFNLRWPRRNVELLPCASHMLNPMSAPPLIRLLNAINLDQRAFLMAFDWGQAAIFPFLPRVQLGNFVLALAQWRLTPLLRDQELPTTPAETFQAALPAWRERWQVPRYVWLSVGDNRLVLDLDDARQSDELRVELQHLSEGSALLLQEVFPTLDQAWVQGPGGHYITEFIVPLIRRAPEAASSNRTLVSQEAHPANSDAVSVPSLISSDQRLRGLGSEWLYMKLYCGQDLQDDLIAGPLRDLARDALQQGLAADWFFIRYSDPDPHIRLRFRGDPQLLTGKLLPVLCEWGTWLITKGPCLKYTFDTYDREIERYGGPVGIKVAEALFGADSCAVAELLALAQAHTLELDRTLLAVLSADDLLASLGLAAEERLAWVRQHATARHQSGESYRQHRVLLRNLLGNSLQTLATMSGGTEVLAVLAKRREALVPVAQQLGELVAQQVLEKPLTELSVSYAHLHCNRLLGTDRRAEEAMLGLLLRTRESLERAPVARGDLTQAMTNEQAS